jgi:hypothetical protein
MLSDVITPTLSQGHKITKFDDDRRADAAWDAVVAQVTKQDCYLDTVIDEPSWHA